VTRSPSMSWSTPPLPAWNGPISINRHGSLADLLTEIDQHRNADVADQMSWVPHTYWHATLCGNARLGPLMNDRYPLIRPTGVYRLVKEHLAHRTVPQGAEGW
jgi:hypothetical protein